MPTKEEIKAAKFAAEKAAFAAERESTKKDVENHSLVIQKAKDFLADFISKGSFENDDEKSRIIAYCEATKYACKQYNSAKFTLGAVYSLRFFLNLEYLTDQIYSSYKVYFCNPIYTVLRRKIPSDKKALELIKSTLETLMSLNKAGFSMVMYPSQAVRIKLKEFINSKKHLLK